MHEYERARQEAPLHERLAKVFEEYRRYPPDRCGSRQSILR
ncbi:hypothetical protein [Phyllobacterium brassicacearum]|nr:hypothetical protein [Phyllobacterium brassicacearum]